MGQIAAIATNSPSCWRWRSYHQRGGRGIGGEWGDRRETTCSGQWQHQESQTVDRHLWSTKDHPEREGGRRESEREKENIMDMHIIQWAGTLSYLTDYFIVVGHTVVDQSESIVARATRVGPDQEPSITFCPLLEQSNCSLHIVCSMLW